MIFDLKWVPVFDYPASLRNYAEVNAVAGEKRPKK
jgi:hypothetical protein